MSVEITSSDPKWTHPSNNRFYATARIIVASNGTITVHDLARRARISQESAYQGWLAFRGVTEALRDCQLLPYDAAPVGEPASVSQGEILTLEQARQILKGPTRLG